MTNAWRVRSLTFITHVNSNNFVMWEIQHNNADLELFQDSDFAEDLEDSKSTSGGVLCIFGSHTFVPASWMCKKQTSVSHSSIEAELKSSGAGLRLDGIPALDLWDLVIEVLHSSLNQPVQGNLCDNEPSKKKKTPERRNTPTEMILN